MAPVIKFMKDVCKELTEMQQMGVKITDGMLENAFDKELMASYMNMSVTDCASLIIEMNSFTTCTVQGTQNV